MLLENDLKAIETIFDFIWKEVRTAEDVNDCQILAEDLAITDLDSKISQQPIKDHLLQNTQEHVQSGILGVPTFVVEDELFFGQDSIEFLNEYVQNPEILKSNAIICR